MKKSWKIAISIIGILLIGIAWFVNNPVDIRPAQLKNKISKEDLSSGKALLQEMQNAYGGKEKWLSFQTGSYAQTADWYEDKLNTAAWDTLPQQFQMTSILGTDDSEFTLLNGPNTGQTWGVKDWKSYQKSADGSKNFVHNEKYHHKLIYKNYWFQFPYRIGEAPIIAYGGERIVEGKKYDLLFATWGSEKANREYDQYVLYLNKQTRMVEWLNFTLREKFKFIHITARFADFKSVNGITVPFSQYIKVGYPNEDGIKMHENRYAWIQFGEKRVSR